METFRCKTLVHAPRGTCLSFLFPFLRAVALLVCRKRSLEADVLHYCRWCWAGVESLVDVDSLPFRIRRHCLAVHEAVQVASADE